MKTETERAEIAIIAILAIFMIVLAALSVWGCAPGVSTTARATALNGMYSPAYPMYQWPAPQYQSLYVVPRVSCANMGYRTVCRPI